MAPLIDFITSTIAPGTWRIVDTSGEEITGPSDSKKTGAAGRSDKSETGQIVPFFLSISLIIRHDAEVHEQVAKLFRGIANFLTAPNQKKNMPSLKRASRCLSPRVCQVKLRNHPTRPEQSLQHVPVPIKSFSRIHLRSTRPIARPAAIVSSERIRKLLKEIEEVVEQLAGKP